MYAWVFYKFNNNNLCNFNYSNKTYQNDSYDENIFNYQCKYNEYGANTSLNFLNLRARSQLRLLLLFVKNMN